MPGKIQPRFCWMCQQNLRGLEHREHESQEAVGFVKQYCQPTPYWYTWLVNNDEDAFLCVACLSWKRRCELMGEAGLRRGAGRSRVMRKGKVVGPKLLTKNLLQVDHAILFLMYPGQYTAPDRRWFPRVLKSLRDESSVLQMMIPLPVKKILSMTEGKDSIHTLVFAWWKVNSETHFFSHPSLAKLVRAAVKKEKGLEDEEGE